MLAGLAIAASAALLREAMHGIRIAVEGVSSVVYLMVRKAIGMAF